MKTKDYYKILNVKVNSSQEEIKKQYRTLAKQYHPDANNGSKQSEEKFKKVTEAYETLGDKGKRKDYDQQRRSGFNRGPRPRHNPWQDQGYDFSQDPGGFREDPFQRGSGFKQQTEQQTFDPDAPTRGFDLQFILEVPLEIVALGGKVPYTYEKYVTCADCEGTGKIDGEDCVVCAGKRLTIEELTIDVEVPPGVADSYTLRLELQGGAGRNGAPPGDLFLKIQTLPHPLFKRKQTDIYSEVQIPRELADSGGTIEIQTLESLKTIKVEEGTLTGEELRLSGEGCHFPWDKKRGDLIIKFFVSDD